MIIPLRALSPVAVLLLASATTSCVNTEREALAKDPHARFTPPSGRGERVGGATVLNTVRATHPFSGPKTSDIFILQLRGPRILSSRAHLLVLSSTGDTLRHEVLPATALIDDCTLRDNQSASVRDQEISVLRGMNTFFASSHFVQPAVPATAPQPAEIDTQAWSSLRDDPRAVGFDYPGSGGEMRLAYSQQLGRVVLLNK